MEEKQRIASPIKFLVEDTTAIDPQADNDRED
jgi:hypothetical protein